jgi:hypothetical protein
MANSATTVEIFAGSISPGDLGASKTLRLWDPDWSTNPGPPYDVVINGSNTGTDFAGSYFGYYLDAQACQNGGFWYSDTSLNSDGMDHMYAYQGEGDTVRLPGGTEGPWTDTEYVLAWEDLVINGGDEDYNDFVVMVESVEPIPVPGALLLGLLGLTAAGVKLRKFA